MAKRSRQRPPSSQRPVPASRHRLRRGLAVAALSSLLVACVAGCAGRKGRNDDDPRPNEYSIRMSVEPLAGR